MKRTPVITLALGFALLVGVFVAVVYFVARLQEASGDLRRNFDLTAELLEILNVIQNAENGQRGYLITGERLYLDPYNEAVTEVGTRLVALRAASAPDPFLAEKADQLSSALSTRLRDLASTIDTYDISPPTAIAVVRSGQGLSVTAGIRNIIAEMRQYQAKAQAASFSIYARAADRLQTAVAAGLAGAILFGIIAVLSARRNAAHLEEQSYLAAVRAAELEAKNEQLQDEIVSRQQAEGQLRQIQKMEAVGQLTGGMAHDFNNMLAVVMSAISLIRRKIGRGEYDIEKFLEGASDAAERSASLTRRLLAFSRQQALEPEVIEANQLVDGMMELLRRTIGENVHIETALADGLWATFADGQQLENAIINLAANARDAMAEAGGSITIATANVNLSEADVRDHAGAEPGAYVKLSVSDNGPGMSEDVLARAFDPFFTTKAVGKGTGLGLSQVYGFVRQSGGHVAICSRQGRGAEVMLYLPRYTGQDVARERQRQSDITPRGEAKEVVLVTEDDDRLRLLATESLVELGYTVIDVRGGEEALEVLRARDDISLLLTDMVMPRMTGRQLAETAREFRPDLKILYTTGFSRNAASQAQTPAIKARTLPKPFTMGQLGRAVREALDTAG